MSNPNERLVMPEYGQVVTIREKYCRRQRRHEKRGTWKCWEIVPYEAANCIFLGTRVLHNGTREYDYEEGYSFHSHESFVAALVSPGQRRNPVYVPLESIEA